MVTLVHLARGTFSNLAFRHSIFWPFHFLHISMVWGPTAGQGPYITARQPILSVRAACRILNTVPHSSALQADLPQLFDAVSPAQPLKTLLMAAGSSAFAQFLLNIAGLMPFTHTLVYSAVKLATDVAWTIPSHSATLLFSDEVAAASRAACSRLQSALVTATGLLPNTYDICSGRRHAVYLVSAVQLLLVYGEPPRGGGPLAARRRAGAQPLARALPSGPGLLALPGQREGVIWLAAAAAAADAPQVPRCWSATGWS
jgi:hypothetical protein